VSPHVLGTVVRLQVQRSRLKPGPRSTRVYDPSPLLEVPALELEPRGVVGLVDGRRVQDVHHADHPDSRHRGLNGLSLLPRAHYARLRTRFGNHLVDGVAGESLLLETEGPWTPADLTGDLVLETADGGLLALADPAVAAPCLEFTRFCLGREPGRVDEEVTAALAELDGGARGFYLTATGVGRVESGARLLRR
jgi:hypothetical protein